MKSFFTIILLSAIGIAQAQEVNDYHYIIIPQNLTGFENNEYKIKNHLNQLLKDKNYKTISYNNANWPEDLRQNPCLGLTVDAKRVKSMMTNRIEVEFKNCQNAVVATMEGNSRIKEFEAGFQDAIHKAIEKLPVSHPKEITIAPNDIKPNKVQAEIIESKEIATQKSVPSVMNTNQLSDGKTLFQKVDLQNGGFMIMSENGTQVIARFEPTLRPNVYRVHVMAENLHTIGYQNHNGISYEVVEGNTWKEVKLLFK